MADDKVKPIKMITPRVTFIWPKLNEPDYGNEKFPKPDGEFSVKARCKADDPAVVEMLNKLQPLLDAAIAKGKVEFSKLKVDQRKKLKDITVNPLFSTVYDQETEEATGDIEFKFAMAHSGTIKKGPKAGKKWERSPALFDAKGKPMKAAIWSGTIGKVSFTVNPDGYFIPGTGAVGLKLGLEAVQVIQLANGRDRNAGSYGFGTEEDGYSEDDAPQGGFSDESGDAGDSSDDDQGNGDF